MPTSAPVTTLASNAGVALTHNQMDANWVSLQAAVQAATNSVDVATAVTAAVQVAIATMSAQIQAQIQGLNLNSLATANGALNPANIGPVLDTNVTYTQATFNALVAQLARAGGTQSPTAPVKNTAPTVAFPGGTGDVGEIPVLTMTTPFTGATTSIDVQILANGVVIQTVLGATTGMNLPAITPANATGVRSYQVIALGNWSGGTAIPNPSVIYTINAAAVPVSTVAPLIQPAAATELSTLVPARGTYTVNGVIVANTTLTFTQRWTTDWTLTGALVAATSANLNATWGGVTGTYTVKFSDGSSKSTTLTNGSAAFSWTGAVTATSAIAIQLATTPSLALNLNNIAHAIHYYETPTGSGAGSEVQASNTITPTASSSGGGGGGGGGVDAGRLWQSSISASGSYGTPLNWVDYQAFRAAYPPPQGRTSLDAQAWYNTARAISGGTILAGFPTAAQINAALASNAVVGIPPGTTANYTAMNTMIVVPANGTLYVTGGGFADFDCTNNPLHAIQLNDGAHLIGVSVHGTQGAALWFNGNNQRVYKFGHYNCCRGGWPSFAANGSLDVIMVSCEGFYCAGGGEGDSFKCGPFGGGNWTLVDCTAVGGDDDGVDEWSSSASNFYHYVTCQSGGKGTSLGGLYLAGGDANGFKLGGPAGSTIPQFLNQCSALNNGTVSGTGGCGFNANGSAAGVLHVLKQCTTSGNLNGNYYFSNTADPAYFLLVGAPGGGGGGGTTGTILLDASTPARTLTTQLANVETGVSPAFSPPANSWIYVDIAGDPSAGAETPTFNTPTNTGTALSWALVGSVNNASGGAVATWRAFNANAQAGIIVTATITWAGGNALGGGGMWTRVLTGAKASQAGAAVASTTNTQAGAKNFGVTTTAANSRVVMTAVDWNVTTPAPTSSDTIDSYTVPNNTTGGSAHKANNTATPGAVTVNLAWGAGAPIASYIAYEILSS